MARQKPTAADLIMDLGEDSDYNDYRNGWARTELHDGVLTISFESAEDYEIDLDDDEDWWPNTSYEFKLVPVE